jgi:hypothetical protein
MWQVVSAITLHQSVVICGRPRAAGTISVTRERTCRFSRCPFVVSIDAAAWSHADQRIGEAMSKSVLLMSMSLDGFVAGPNETPENGLGDNGERLHRWFFGIGAETGQGGVPGSPAGANGQIMDELMATGAVVAGGSERAPAKVARPTSPGRRPGGPPRRLS